MDPTTTFFIALGILFALASLTLLCVQRPLNDILLEICGAPHRARFWSRFFGAALLLTALFFCLWSPPDPNAEGVVLDDIVRMMRAGLFGMLSAMGLLALVMMYWQSRFEVRARANTGTDVADRS